MLRRARRASAVRSDRRRRSDRRSELYVAKHLGGGARRRQYLWRPRIVPWCAGWRPAGPGDHRHYRLSRSWDSLAILAPGHPYPGRNRHVFTDAQRRGRALTGGVFGREFGTMATVEAGKIGIVGAGVMGFAMAKNLRAAGFSVFGYDPAQAARDRLRDIGG